MVTPPVEIKTDAEAKQPPVEERLSMSYEDFLVWSNETQRSEWVNGEVIVFMPPRMIHQRLSSFIDRLLADYVEHFELGIVLPAPFEMKLENSSREPDLLFVAAENQERLTAERLNGPADLVVEIISDSSVARDRAEKFYEYQAAGIREYWIIDPRPEVARSDFYHLTSQGQYQAALPDETGRYHSAILPNFWLRPSWFESDPLPNPLVCLAEIAPQLLRDALDQHGHSV